MSTLLTKLRKDFPQIAFAKGNDFSWSPYHQQINYKATGKDVMAAWSLFHELGHAILGHNDYSSDFELVKLEATAWHTATELAAKYGYKIDQEHVQDCLDTYRDWLHRRSTCPVCGNRSLQQDPHHYQCFNCETIWRVSTSRFCRPYRLLQKEAVLVH